MDAPVFARTRPRRRHGELRLTREPACDVLLFGLFLRGDSNVSVVQAAKYGSGRVAFLSSMRCVHIASGLSAAGSLAASTALGVTSDWPKLTV